MQHWQSVFPSICTPTYPPHALLNHNASIGKSTVIKENWVTKADSHLMAHSYRVNLPNWNIRGLQGKGKVPGKGFPSNYYWTHHNHSWLFGRNTRELLQYTVILSRTLIITVSIRSWGNHACFSSTCKCFFFCWVEYVWRYFTMILLKIFYSCSPCGSAYPIWPQLLIHFVTNLLFFNDKCDVEY